MTGPVLIKLGGSLLTDKARPDTARDGTIRRLAGEIAELRRDPGCPPLILGHGSGSFGHGAAARYRLQEGLGDDPGDEPSKSEPSRDDERTRRLAGIPITRERATALHRRVMDALTEAGALPYSLAPSSFLVTEDGRPVPPAAPPEPLLLALSLGLLPVVYGDVVMDRVRGVAICSTEGVLSALTAALLAGAPPIRPQLALWLGTTDGVLTPGGEPLGQVSAGAGEAALAAAGGAGATDVTGGMHHRLESALELARRGVPSRILDGTRPGCLARALLDRPITEPRSDDPGTWVV